AFLGRVISTEIVEDFYLEYDEAKPLVDRKLKKCRIRKVEEVEREREEQKREEWLQNTFKEELGISPEDFLIAFKSTELRYFPTAKQLSSKIKKQVKLSPTRVKSLSIRLFNEYPEIYDKILEQPPKGLEPRKAGKIIHIDFGNKG
ncbi:MAG: hypothetical protein JRI91_16530, partial [Deltaproteobacteria bacterium]|nr:hypothetical protein [Deltaproteobacteria bacterium]